jgi:uncharacterized protein YjdB
MTKQLVGIVGAAAIIAACSNDKTTSAPVVASVTMVPASDTVQVGDTMLTLRRKAQLAAVLKDAGGNVMSVIQTGQSVVWTSSDSTLAAVAQSGIVTAKKIGSATITATIEGKSSTSAIRVDTVSAATLSVSPAIDSVNVGNSVNLKAWPRAANGDTLVARITIWTSSDTSIAIVTNADSLNVAPGNVGVIKGVAPGTVTITASIAGLSATASMKVKP